MATAWSCREPARRIERCWTEPRVGTTWSRSLLAEAIRLNLISPGVSYRLTPRCGNSFPSSLASLPSTAVAVLTEHAVARTTPLTLLASFHRLLRLARTPDARAAQTCSSPPTRTGSGTVHRAAFRPHHRPHCPQTLHWTHLPHPTHPTAVHTRCGHGQTGPDGLRFCFKMPELADAFQTRFGGERLTAR